jgi:glycerophosphoryl diester phosphodiesterase
MRRPRTVGHRGASALARENSLRAFELAIEYGLDMSELDVHLSRDGHVVVVHDADLSRLLNRPTNVGDLTARELRELDVPSLTDVFDLVRGRLGLYVELKGPGTGTAVGGLIAHGAARGIELIGGSFEPSLVGELDTACKDVPRSVLFASTTVGEMVEMCRSVDAIYAHPCFRPITAELVRGLQAAGLQVMTPHTNDPVEAQHFADLGVDVIASDDPRILLPLHAAA